MQEKISSISNRLEKVEGDVAMLQIIISPLANDIRNIQSTMVTKKDFEKFVDAVDKRLTALESR